MSYSAYNLDTNAAKQADAGGRIDQSGKYVGHFKSVEFVTSKKGTQGLEFQFETDGKEYANFTIWTISATGDKLSGFAQVNAIMTCAGVRSLTPTDQKIEKYDFEVKQKIQQLCTVAPELANKPIGVLLQRENYLNSNGDEKHQMNFFAAFNAQSEFIAKEIIDKKTKPEELEKITTRLMQNPVVQRKQGGQSSNAAANDAFAQAGRKAADLDDDLPF